VLKKIWTKKNPNHGGGGRRRRSASGQNGPGAGLFCGERVVDRSVQPIPGGPGARGGGISQLDPKRFVDHFASMHRDSGRLTVVLDARVTRVRTVVAADGTAPPTVVVQWTGGDTLAARAAAPEDHHQSALEVDDVVFCLGPWTRSLLPGILGEVAATVAVPQVAGRAAFSVVLREPARGSLPAVCAFLDIIGCAADHPEIYPRPGGVVYLCCGKVAPTQPGACPASPSDESSSSQPEQCDDPPVAGAGAVQAHVGRDEIARHATILCDIAHAAMGTGMSECDTANPPEPPLVSQVCFLPVNVGTSRPAIGALAPRLWVAAGHSVWGILQAPATGEALAAAVLGCTAVVDGSCDIEPFKP
jgi:hypothetical protein